jgi:hypothetical protein
MLVGVTLSLDKDSFSRADILVTNSKVLPLLMPMETLLHCVTVDVADVTAPTVLAQNITVLLMRMVMLTPFPQVDNGSFDNRGCLHYQLIN